MDDMDRIHYAGGSVLTGSAIAEALVDYAEALAQAGSAGTAVIPTVSDDGTSGESHLLVGPSSQMLTVHEDSDVPDPVDDDWVAEHRRKAQELRTRGAPAPTAVPESPTSAEEWVTEL